MFEVIARKEPYEGEDGNKVIAAIKDKNIKKRVVIPSYVSEKARSVMMDCMEENPDARATFDEINTRLQRMDTKSLVPCLTKPGRSMNDVFPEPIAQVLQEGGRVDDDRTYNAMLFACSITGLDEILAKMSPFQVSRMKERLHNNLLGPAKKHGVFLLETDGNVFMAASNIVEEKPDYDHGMRMVHFAMDACQQTRSRLTTPSKEVMHSFASRPVFILAVSEPVWLVIAIQHIAFLVKTSTLRPQWPSTVSLG